MKGERPLGVFDIARALAERDLAGRLAYRVSFVFGLFSSFLFIIALYYVAQLIPPEAVGGHGYFAVTAIGLGTFTMIGSVSTAGRSFLINELGSGTVETLMSLHPRLIDYINAASMIQFLRTLLSTVAIIGIGCWVEGGIYARGVVGGIGVIFASALSGLGIGYLQAALELRVRRLRRMGGLVASAGLILSGVWFPVEKLPEILQMVANFIPATHAIRLMRSLLLVGSFDLKPILWLTGLTLVLLLAGRIVFASAEKATRRDGSYLVY